MLPRPYPIAELPDDTVHARGCRVLAYVLEVGACFELSDDDLRLADHVYPIAIANPEILPAVVDRLSAVRHLILRTITTRQAIDRDRLAQLGAELESVPPTGGQQPGRAVPLQPAPRPLAPVGDAIAPRPVPRPQPADIAF